MSDKILDKINEIIKRDIEPSLAMDGGGLEIVDFDEKKGILSVALQGACVGCPMRQMTLEQGIGMTIKKQIPEVKEVVAI